MARSKSFPHLSVNPVHWKKPKWLPSLLAMPVPDPSLQAGRILAMQRNIVLPVKAVLAGAVLYFLFYSHPRVVVLGTLQNYFIFYITFNALVAILLVFRRFPPGLVQWVVFTVGLVDGVLLAGLTLVTDPDHGFQSPLYWVFPGLIIVNALSIPLATPQIALNLSLCALFLGAGVADLNLPIHGDSNSDTMMRAEPIYHRLTRVSTNDIDLKLFANRLLNPARAGDLSDFIRSQLSAQTMEWLSAYKGGSNPRLQKALTDDLNHIVSSGAIYDSKRFAGINLSDETRKLLDQDPKNAELVRLNWMLLLEAFPSEIMRVRRGDRFMGSTRDRILPADEVPVMFDENEFVLRLIILLLVVASCYGIQLLSFRQRLSEEEERKSAARNDELKAAGRLAAEIAHQLKNPLGIINNAIFSVKRGLNEGRRDFSLQLEIIQEEIERSDSILTQLMGYAQLSEGRVERLNVTEELDRAINEVLPAGASYAIEVNRNYASELPSLLMQRSHLSVVLVNLLQNAREAMNGQGTVVVDAQYRGDDAVEIGIADAGPGIAADKLDQIFEAYFTSKLKGTGLGLAIVKHNVELYGGTVYVESELGRGARFVLLFPAKTLIKTV